MPLTNAQRAAIAVARPNELDDLMETIFLSYINGEIDDDTYQAAADAADASSRKWQAKHPQAPKAAQARPARSLQWSFPGFPQVKTYAKHPVWRDSTTDEARFQPMTRRAARQLWHKARDFERQTKEPGKHGGAIGRVGLAIVYAFTHDFLNFRSGALYPSYAAIARATNYCEKSVERALKKLKAAGMLNWLRRCVEAVAPAGGFLLRQISNAYALLPCSQWRGYKPPSPAPAPDPTCWGARLPQDPVSEAGTDKTARRVALEAEAAGSGVAAVWARFIRAEEAKSPANSETVRVSMKP